MKKVDVRRNFVLVLVVFMLFGVLFLAGCNKTSQSKEDIAVFEMDEQVVKDAYGICLKRGSDCYSLNGWITDENGQEHGIGIDCNQGPLTMAYWVIDDYAVITTDDFDPIAVRRGEKISCYNSHGFLIIPAEFVGYSPRACIRDKSHGSDGHRYFKYWDGNEEVTVLDYDTVSIFDGDMSDVAGGHFSKGDACTLGWMDLDGSHEVDLIANSRYYRQNPEKAITIEMDGSDMLEYDTSELEPGTYLVLINNDCGWGSIITIE